VFPGDDITKVGLACTHRCLENDDCSPGDLEEVEREMLMLRMEEGSFKIKGRCVFILLLLLKNQMPITMAPKLVSMLMIHHVQKELRRKVSSISLLIHFLRYKRCESVTLENAASRYILRKSIGVKCERELEFISLHFYEIA
jgi:hypothetical protein